MSSNHDGTEHDNPDPPRVPAPAPAATPPAGAITAAEVAKEAKLGLVRGGVGALVMAVFKHMP
ncbi:hypothetical protein [Streptomyces sp. NPDC020983]|uniref:hypothetical protein n=1 Tax=Streptomyces sp. NPDC020983 TaxID=3365106 RepID=UPI0037B35C0B